MYDIILFDLDGTLTDPGEGITNSVAHALRKWGIEVEDRRELYKFIGPPLKFSFETYYGFSAEDAERAIVYYREYFADKGIFENTIYDGTRDLLEKLRRDGKKLILATSKPEPFAVRILEHFGIDGYFDFVAGATMDEKRNEKGDVIEYALKEFGVEDKGATVMIGDRRHDVIGAHKAGIDSVGVLFGYGSEEELSSAGATFIAKDFEEIYSFVTHVSHNAK